MKKITKTKINKWLKKVRSKFEIDFNFGKIDPQQGRILVLILAIIFISSGFMISQILASTRSYQSQIQPESVKRNVLLEKEINKMVEGYPIENMTPYIAKQDPKVAAFMIAIAKKESAWGKRKPVLNGEDCYNYWGFRLKSEKMGSGGHTCFDSPKEAVEVVGDRLDELVNNENIDSPKEMIVWKCGYGCQDKSKTADEKKWISDVAMYYQKMEEKI
jgi:hypothetical protein